MRNKILFLALVCTAMTISVSGQTVSLVDASIMPSPLDPFQSHRRCRVSLVDASIMPSPVTYDPYSGSDTYCPQFTFTVKLSSKPNSNVYFAVVIDGSSSPASRTLTFSSDSLTIGFYKDSSYTSEIKSTSNYSPSYYISGSFARKTDVLTQTFTVYPRIAKGQSAPWGNYTGTFSIKLYQSSTPTGTLRDTEIIYYTAVVEQTVDVRVGPSNGTFDTGVNLYSLDLGELSQGASTSFGIFVRGTTGYTLTMNASSGGYLTSNTTNDKIKYSLTINGKSYTPGPSVTIDSQTSRALYSKVFLGTITVPSGQDVEAGQYSDSLNFTVTAN